jgi:hypothetical protein
MSFLKRAAVVASAAIVVSLAAAVPVGAGVTTTTGEGETATLTVNKVVQGTAPADAEFVIAVECESSGPFELTYGPEGGAEEVIFFEPDFCTVTETETGGAVDVTPPIDIAIEDPIPYEVTVTNVFDTAPTSSSTTASVAADAATRPTFTG